MEKMKNEHNTLKDKFSKELNDAKMKEENLVIEKIIFYIRHFVTEVNFFNNLFFPTTD
jgi:hypothetical protein